MTITIEAIDLTQAAHARALLELLDHYARDPMGGGTPLSAEAHEHLVPRLRQRGDFFGFLACSGDRAVGLIHCFEGFSTFAARPLLNVHDIAVYADYRGQGIGKQLLAAAETLARARGCCKLTLEVLSHNHAALHAYRQAGFTPYELDPAAGQALFMHKRLSESA